MSKNKNLRRSFTQRELEVLQLLAWGHGTFEAAQLLDISPWTVKNHLASASRKMKNQKDRTAMVTEALRLKLISLEPPSPLGDFTPGRDT